MFGTQGRICSGTARIQSDTATTGPAVFASLAVTYGTGACWSGCRSACRSMDTPSRFSSPQLVTDHTSAATSQLADSMSAARSASGIETPDARICALLERFSGAARNRYMPRRTPSGSKFSGSAGCWYGSL